MQIGIKILNGVERWSTFFCSATFFSLSLPKATKLGCSSVHCSRYKVELYFFFVSKVHFTEKFRLLFRKNEDLKTKLSRKNGSSLSWLLPQRLKRPILQFIAALDHWENGHRDRSFAALPSVSMELALSPKLSFEQGAMKPEGERVGKRKGERCFAAPFAVWAPDSGLTWQKSFHCRSIFNELIRPETSSEQRRSDGLWGCEGVTLFTAYLHKGYQMDWIVKCFVQIGISCTLKTTQPPTNDHIEAKQGSNKRSKKNRAEIWTQATCILSS